jgi:hypothetical protein
VLPVIHCRQSCRQREDDGDPICTQANPREFLTPEILCRGIPILVSKGSQLPSGIEADAAWEAWMAVAQDGDTVQARDALNAGQRS